MKLFRRYSISKLNTALLYNHIIVLSGNKISRRLVSANPQANEYNYGR